MNRIIKRNENAIDNFAKRFFGDDEFFSMRPTFGLFNESNAGKANIIDNENEYVIQLSVPGFKKDDINVELNDEVLTISSKVEKENEENEKNYYRKEFIKSSFERSFVVPDNVKIDKIDAKMEDGVLNVLVPKKKEEKKESKVSIKIK